MASEVSHIGDVIGDSRSEARATSELLVRVGTLEGRVIAVTAAVDQLQLTVARYRDELDSTLASVRASTGRSKAAAERVRQAQSELQEQVLQVRQALLQNRLPGAQ